MSISAVLLLALASTSALAQDTPMSCWAVAGWTTDPSSGVERANLLPTSCHTTASNQGWVQVQQLYMPLPEAVWLKVLHHDPHVSNGEFFMTPTYGGLDANEHPIVDLEFFYNHSNRWPLQSAPPDPCGDEVSFFDGSSAPGTWDSANCQVEGVPDGARGFVYNNSYYLEPEPGIVCDLGVSDGRNCWIGTMPSGATPFTVGDRLYITRPSGSPCSLGYPASGKACLIGQVSPHARPFIYSGQLYVTSVRDCVDGEYDGANCYLGTAPAGRAAFIWPDASGSFYYAL